MPIDHERTEASQFLKHVDYHPRLDSTNSRAIELARNASLETPALVICDLQTKGRGRGANRWKSSAGNLAFSLIVELPANVSANKMVVPADRSLLLSPMTALAVCHSLESIHNADRFEIKWPNDVFVRQRKVSGILIETVHCQARQSRITRYVIGCGINVNMPITSRSHTDDDLQSAISLIDIEGVEANLTEVLLKFVDSFATCLDRLAVNTETLVDEIRSRCLLTGRQVVVMQGTRRIEGECIGLDDNGALKIRTEKGDVSVISGTIDSF